ncbi:LysR substrate-binding domain-containing protein [Undibacterium sp.]|uniref:LysR substrate-binding domain-containing protein n=1 Tax=Undibacterium sp. TaxID=1914977 RepID=UPI00374CB918
MDLDELRIFVRVADLASFSRAAEQLGLAKGHVSTSIRQLEASLGTRLLQRTTRSVHLTQDGERFLERCQELLGEAEQVQAMFQPVSGGLSGRLRIDLPSSFARDVIIPRLPEFLNAHPQLEIGISTTDRRVDLVQEGFDCLMRIGALGDSDLVARPVGMMRMANAASPGYIAQYGMPQTLADLAQHRVVNYTPKLTSADAIWEYFHAASGRYQNLPVKAMVAVNGTDAYQAAALAGLGMIQAPVLGLQRLFDEGRLVPVLPEFTAAPMPVSLLYANRRQLAPRVQAVMAWLTSLAEPFLTQHKP